MGLAPSRELAVLESLYTTDRPSDVNLKLLAEFLNVTAKQVAEGLELNESTVSRNPYAPNSAHLKQWQIIFSLIIEIIVTADPALSSEEVRIKMQRWLKLPRPEFSDKSSVDLMLEGKARRVRNLLEQLA
jgi:hypothetical protein